MADNFYNSNTPVFPYAPPAEDSLKNESGFGYSPYSPYPNADGSADASRYGEYSFTDTNIRTEQYPSGYSPENAYEPYSPGYYGSPSAYGEQPAIQPDYSAPSAAADYAAPGYSADAPSDKYPVNSFDAYYSGGFAQSYPNPYEAPTPAPAGNAYGYAPAPAEEKPSYSFDIPSDFSSYFAPAPAPTPAPAPAPTPTPLPQAPAYGYRNPYAEPAAYAPYKPYTPAPAPAPQPQAPVYQQTYPYPQQQYQSYDYSANNAAYAPAPPAAQPYFAPGYGQPQYAEPYNNAPVYNFAPPVAEAPAQNAPVWTPPAVDAPVMEAPPVVAAPTQSAPPTAPVAEPVIEELKTVEQPEAPAPVIDNIVEQTPVAETIEPVAPDNSFVPEAPAPVAEPIIEQVETVEQPEAEKASEEFPVFENIGEQAPAEPDSSSALEALVSDIPEAMAPIAEPIIEQIETVEQHEAEQPLSVEDFPAFENIAEQAPAEPDSSSALEALTSDIPEAKSPVFEPFTEQAQTAEQHEAEQAPSAEVVTPDEQPAAQSDVFSPFASFGSDFGIKPPEQSEAVFEPAPQENVEQAIDRVANEFSATAELPQNTEQIYKIAEEMSRSVLANSYNKIFNENNLSRERKSVCLRAEGISADYYLLRNGGEPYLMYDNVDITVRDGACVALISDVKLASYALAKTISELSDARSENIITSETEDGYERETLYIGNDNMLPNDMTAMEYMLFALRHIDIVGDEDILPEDKLEGLLVQIGFGNLAHAAIKDLTHNQRILLIALSAALNPYIGCIIINDPLFKTNHNDDMLARRVFAKLTAERKGVLLSGCSEHLMSIVANHVTAIRNGRVVYDGPYKMFLDKYCLGIMSFTSSNPDGTVEFFVRNHPNISALTNGNLVYLLRKHEGDIDLDRLLKDAIKTGADHRSIVLDEQSFQIASKEVLRGI